MEVINVIHILFLLLGIAHSQGNHTSYSHFPTWKLWVLLKLTSCIIISQAPSRQEFENGVTSNNFPKPSGAQYNGFTKSLKQAGITRKLEGAMYLAQTLHESGGLRAKREHGCSGSGGCISKYPADREWLAECQGANRPKNVGYYGRGYIQLTWCSNYVPASKAIFKDGNKLKSNPDQVAQSEDLSWGVSGWYWGERVHAGVANSDQFGLTTKAINGQSEECQGNGKNADKSRQRFRYYQNVFKAFRLAGTPNPAGCSY